MTAVPKRDTRVEVPSIDGFRGLAVMFIVLGHCWHVLGGKVELDGGPIRNIFVSSYTGVDMLFIVSGFVLFLPIAMSGSFGDTSSYAWRRIARIVPAFYVALLFSYLVAAHLGQLHGGVWRWVSHLLFLHTEAHPPSEIGFGVNGAMWTMAVEVMFYASLPLVAVRYVRRPFVGLMLAVGLAELWHVGAVNLPGILEWAGWSWSATSQAQQRLALAFPSYLGHFAIGMTGAWLYTRLRSLRTTRRFSKLVGAVQLAALFGAVAVLYMRGAEGVANTSGPLDHWVKTLDRAFFFGVLVLATSLASRRARWFVENPVSRSLGIACYGIYLVHLPVIHLMISTLDLEKGTTSNADLFRLMAVVVPITVIVGLLSYTYLEEPFRRWARKRRRRSRTVQPEAPVALAAAQV